MKLYRSWVHMILVLTSNNKCKHVYLLKNIFSAEKEFILIFQYLSISFLKLHRNIEELKETRDLFYGNFTGITKEKKSTLNNQQF